MNTPTPLVQPIGTKRLHKATCGTITGKAVRPVEDIPDTELARATKATCCRPLTADALIGGAALRVADSNGTTPPVLARVSQPTRVAVDGVAVAETRRVDFPTMVPGAEPTEGTGELAGGDVQPMPPRPKASRRGGRKDGGAARAAEVEARRAGLSPVAVTSTEDAPSDAAPKASGVVRYRVDQSDPSSEREADVTAIGDRWEVRADGKVRGTFVRYDVVDGGRRYHAGGRLFATTVGGVTKHGWTTRAEALRVILHGDPRGTK